MFNSTGFEACHVGWLAKIASGSIATQGVHWMEVNANRSKNLHCIIYSNTWLSCVKCRKALRCRVQTPTSQFSFHLQAHPQQHMQQECHHKLSTFDVTPRKHWDSWNIFFLIPAIWLNSSVTICHRNDPHELTWPSHFRGNIFRFQEDSKFKVFVEFSNFCKSAAHSKRESHTKFTSNEIKNQFLDSMINLE